ncbi:hypothetical protein DESUT3_04630 [Desulfuromonas versatilis]|uniref:Uncharacterized protein n=1 Tax=Desulfuromonas versatilis TaxID=2802975 RepID=A0ABN6DVX4_9BACT|nr:hypothetical protein [Desulfuromonas versatilis]BCR03394.1 hypothetical protein DESUT3_04630 [Desulfuromonas versatilis]
MLKYCGWCGKYQGVVEAQGHQIRKNLCEIDTTTICPPCLARVTQGERESTDRDR